MNEAEERSALIAAIGRYELTLRRKALSCTPNPLLESGLTIQQLRVLMLLDLDNGAAQHDIAEKLGIGLATVTGLVDRLERRGLVIRVPDASDRRVRRAVLSPAGRELVDRIVLVGQELRERLLAAIDIDALRGLERGLRALCDVLDREEGST